MGGKYISFVLLLRKWREWPTSRIAHQYIHCLSPLLDFNSVVISTTTVRHVINLPELCLINCLIQWTLSYITLLVCHVTEVAKSYTSTNYGIRTDWNTGIDCSIAFI